MAATAISTGALILLNTEESIAFIPPNSVIFAPSFPIPEISGDMPLVVFPITTNSGPNPATRAAHLTIVDCNCGSALANALTISVAF